MLVEEKDAQMAVVHTCLFPPCPQVDRLMLVAVFNLSCYHSQANRDGKPFNPLLGETYEWRSGDGTMRWALLA